jgi:arsenate reductase
VVKKKVLFVCLGNSCRSQMAEGFARSYGADVIEAQSAGLAPAPVISPLTLQVMAERNIDMSHAWPKSIYDAPGGPFDLVVNISGFPLPSGFHISVREWTVQDPIAYGRDVYEEVAQDLEARVMQLILELRGQPKAGEPRPVASPPAGKRGPFPMGPGGSRRYRRNRN